MNKKALIAIVTCCLLAPKGMQAQLSTNPDKFLGNITTDWPGSMNYDGFIYSDYWNQVTPENGTIGEAPIRLLTTLSKKVSRLSSTV